MPQDQDDIKGADAMKQAPTAPVEASGSDAWTDKKIEDLIDAALMQSVDSDWPIDGGGLVLAALKKAGVLNCRPQPSGETREQVARIVEALDGSKDRGDSSVILSQSDLRALLSARPAPVASGGQRGDDFTSVHGLWKDQSLSRLERVRAHRFEFGSELKDALEAVDDEAARQNLASKATAPLLVRAREYVVDSLEAHEHSDGRDLLNEIDAALSTASVRAEAQDEGAADQKAKLYDQMRQVAEANGFKSLTEVIAVAYRSREIQSANDPVAETAGEAVGVVSGCARADLYTADLPTGTLLYASPAPAQEGGE